MCVFFLYIKGIIPTTIVPALRVAMSGSSTASNRVSSSSSANQSIVTVESTMEFAFIDENLPSTKKKSGRGESKETVVIV